MKRLLIESNEDEDELSQEEINSIPVIYYNFDEKQKKVESVSIPNNIPEVILSPLLTAELHLIFES